MDKREAEPHSPSPSLAHVSGRSSSPVLPSRGPSAPPPSGSILQLAWKRYLQELSRRPLRTKALTSAAIAGLSDVVAQTIISGRYSNLKRTLAVACFGFLYSGPSAHYWQKFLEWLFSGRKDMQTVLTKVVIDQLSYGPLCNILFMSFATLVLEGRSFGELAAKVRKDYVGVQLNGWRLWPLAALINYRFVPLEFRVLFINVVALVWTTFLLLSAKRAQGAGPVAAKRA